MTTGIYGTIHTPLKPISYAGLITDDIQINVDNVNRYISATLTQEIRDKISYSVGRAEDVRDDLTTLIRKIESDIIDNFSAFKREYEEEISRLNETDSINSENILRLDNKIKNEIDVKISEIINNFDLYYTKAEIDIAASTLKNSIDNEINSVKTSLDIATSELSNNISTLEGKQSEDVAEINIAIENLETKVDDNKNDLLSSIDKVSDDLDAVNTKFNAKVDIETTVATELAKKLNIPYNDPSNNPAGNPIIPVINNDQSISWRQLSVGNTFGINSAVYRNSSGNFFAANPTSKYHVATKVYVDDNLSQISSRVTVTESKLATVSNVMDFIGAGNSLPDDAQAGDVYVITGGEDSGKEYVYDGATWQEFGNSTAISNLETLKADKDYVESEIAKLNSMLDKYHPLNFIKNPSPSSTLFAYGSSDTSIDVSWILNKTPDTISISIEDGNNNLEISTNASSNNVTYNYRWSVNSPEYNNKKSSIEALKIEATDLAGNAVSASISAIFTHYIFFGVTDADIELDELSKQLSTSNNIGDKSANVGADKYFWYCCPKLYGDPTFKVGGFEGGFEKPIVKTYKYANNEIEYNCYRTTNSNLGETKFNIT